MTKNILFKFYLSFMKVGILFNYIRIVLFKISSNLSSESILKKKLTSEKKVNKRFNLRTAFEFLLVKDIFNLLISITLNVLIIFNNS